MYTVYSRIEARASISFLALKTRLQNETGVYLCSTVLAPGRMSVRSATRALFSEFLPLLYIAFSCGRVMQDVVVMCHIHTP
jgi:hypothetical protein